MAPVSYWVSRLAAATEVPDGIAALCADSPGGWWKLAGAASWLTQVAELVD